jgi:DNA-directed RNA polymerase specialized sigma24 family protein
MSIHRHRRKPYNCHQAEHRLPDFAPPGAGTLLCLNQSANAVHLFTQLRVQMLTGLLGNPSERILFATDTERALSHLDPQQRQILTLVHGYGYNTAECAEYLAIDTRTARKRLLTANAALLDLDLAPERTPIWLSTDVDANE